MELEQDQINLGPQAHDGGTHGFRVAERWSCLRRFAVSASVAVTAAQHADAHASHIKPT
jgi:hypothetical protein